VSGLRRFLSARANEGLWLLAIAGIALLTLVQLTIFGSLWCLAWIVDRCTGHANDAL
jgi:hypothetical protein